MQRDNGDLLQCLPTDALFCRAKKIVCSEKCGNIDCFNVKSREEPTAKHPGGRPPKFSGPRRPVTVTLPERTLEQLSRVDDDRARAIVKAVDALSPSGATRPSVDVVEMAPGVGLIVVGSNRALRQIEWLRTIEIAPGRYLLAIPSGTSVDSLEVALGDLIEEAGVVSGDEKVMIENLLQRIRGLRRKRVVSRSEILLVDTRAG